MAAWTNLNPTLSESTSFATISQAGAAVRIAVAESSARVFQIHKRPEDCRQRSLQCRRLDERLWLDYHFLAEH